LLKEFNKKGIIVILIILLVFIVGCSILPVQTTVIPKELVIKNAFGQKLEGKLDINVKEKTAELIPLCHPLTLTRVEVELVPDEKKSSVMCRAIAATTGPTGVEMEALTAVQIALLTIYDMCKAVDRGMTITDVGLVSKTGGKSGTWRREP